MNPFSPQSIQPIHIKPNPYKNIQCIIKKQSPENHGLFIILLNPFFNFKLIDSNFQSISEDPKKQESSLFFTKEIPKKYSTLSGILSNPFLKESQKTEFLDIFAILQKIFNGIQRFIYLYRFKKSRIYNTTDLCGDPIPDNPRLSIIIFQNNTRYMFLLRELNKTIISALSNSEDFFSHPIPCKNPYTNIPFDKSVLYNIYFAIRFSCLKIPDLFHRYFIHDFNLYDFFVHSDEEIREEYLKSYIKDIGTHLNGYIRKIVHNIFIENNIYCLYIHKEFPEDRLLIIMRPYIELFYKLKYTLKLEYSNLLQVILKYQLLQFIKFNRIFGRRKTKKVKIENRIIRVLDFNDKHIEFKLLKNMGYKDSHITNSSEILSKMMREIRDSKKWGFIKIPVPIFTYNEEEEDEEYIDTTQTIDEDEDDEDDEDDENPTYAAEENSSSDNDTQIVSEDSEEIL